MEVHWSAEIHLSFKAVSCCCGALITSRFDFTYRGNEAAKRLGPVMVIELGPELRWRCVS